MDNLNFTRLIFILIAIGFVGYFCRVVWGYICELKVSSRSLWFVFSSQLFETIAYMMLNMVVVLYLTHELKLGDIAAGSYVSIWGTGIIIMTFFIGSLVDSIGIRKMLLIGMIVALGARFFLCFSTNLVFVTIFSFIPLAFSVAVLSPVITVAIKQLTNKKTSALAFAFFSTLIHLGTAIGGWLFDKVRTVFGEYGSVDLGLLGEVSTYRFVMFATFLLTIPAVISVLFVRDLSSKSFLVSSEGNLFGLVFKSIKEKGKESLVLFSRVAREKTFWQFLFLLTIMVGVKFVFFHLHYTFPKYGIRVLGKGAQIGQLVGVLHPILITIFTPLATYLTRKRNSYQVVMWGTLISSLSVFIILIPGAIFLPIVKSDLGSLLLVDWLSLPSGLSHDVLSLYVAFISFILVLSLGEALWAPRLMEYIVQIAPEGREGSYMALSMLPLFIAKPLVGLISGFLLSNYCPQEGSPNHLMVWFWVGVTALISPVGLIVFKRILKKI